LVKKDDGRASAPRRDASAPRGASARLELEQSETQLRPQANGLARAITPREHPENRTLQTGKPPFRAAAAW